MKHQKIFLLAIMGIAVITVGSAHAYAQYSVEDYPDTGGFPTDWLEGEHDKISETCDQALADDVVLRYCQYL